jgi:hypothetical protein
MDLRKDPEISATMAAEYAKSNETKLEGALKRDVGSTDIYLAHFLGPNGAARFLKAQESAPEKSAAKILPVAARHNQSVFYEGGRPLSVASLYSKVQDSIDGTMTRLVTLQKALPEEPSLASEQPKLADFGQTQDQPRASTQQAAVGAEANVAANTSPNAAPNVPGALRLATLSTATQLLSQSPPSFSGMLGESQGSSYGTPKVSMPMPPPLGVKPRPAAPAEANELSPLDGFLRKMRVSWLG